jgi:2-keto-4-pentenoate hydratase/2-oxohepta-3-ene-1,7-dioic acid hydratase in catechol pathway
MKLAAFRHAGRDTWGSVEADRIVEAPAGLCAQVSGVADALALSPAELARHFVAGLPRLRLCSVQLLPPVANPGRILCVGLNYRAHIEEVAREMPKHPTVFLRANDTLLGHGGDIVRPAVSSQLDFEGELAMVIGRGGHHIRAEDAMAHVAGYTCFNDVSVRDFQKHSVTAGKNFPATAPCGPWIVTADEVLDPTAMTVTTRLNGQQMQHARVDTLVYPLAELIAYLSSIAPLRRGDIIATGTPAGVGSGRKPPLWMKPGDRIEVEIEGVGTLANTVVAEPTLQDGSGHRAQGPGNAEQSAAH